MKAIGCEALLPAANAEEAAAIGIEQLGEAQYRQLQQLGEFDTKTSSWIATPREMRALGGAQSPPQMRRPCRRSAR